MQTKRKRKADIGVMEWLDGERARDATFRREVEALLAEMELEQDLAALREARRISQAKLARRLGVSQPYIAKLESGRVKNLELRTLVRYATALGGRVRITIEPADLVATDRARASRRDPGIAERRMRIGHGSRGAIPEGATRRPVPKHS